jgi:hypothetical protein
MAATGSGDGGRGSKNLLSDYLEMEAEAAALMSRNFAFVHTEDPPILEREDRTRG